MGNIIKSIWNFFNVSFVASYFISFSNLKGEAFYVILWMVLFTCFSINLFALHLLQVKVWNNLLYSLQQKLLIIISGITLYSSISWKLHKIIKKSRICNRNNYNSSRMLNVYKENQLTKKPRKKTTIHHINVSLIRYHEWKKQTSLSCSLDLPNTADWITLRSMFHSRCEFY